MKTRPHLTIEALENRWVPSTLQVVNGLLTYNASPGVANNLTIAISGANYVLTDTSEKISAPGLAGSGTNTVIVPIAFVDSMHINLGDLADRLTVAATLDPISVKAGVGDDIIDVGRFATGLLSGVQAPVTVEGEAGSDSVRINDTASTAPRAYTIAADKVTPVGSADVNYAAVEQLAVTAGGGADTFTVRATAAGTTTTLLGSAGADTFNVGSVTSTLDDIKGRLVLVGGGNPTIPFLVPDSVNLFDQGNAVGNNYAVRDNSVTRSGIAAIAYSEVERLALNAGTAADGLVVLSTSLFTPVTLNMGNGNDVVEVATRTGSSLDLIRSVVTVNGEGGADTVNLNDNTDANANGYLIDAINATRNGTKILRHETVESLILNAGAFDDQAVVQSTQAFTIVTFRMGSGNDLVIVGGASLDPILGRVNVDGQAGTDLLRLNDQGRTGGVIYGVSATGVTRAFSSGVGYVGMEDLTINAANASSPIPILNTFFVHGTSIPTTLNGASNAKDIFLVGSGTDSLDDIRGPLTVNGFGGLDLLELRDQGDTNANSYVVTSTGVARAGSALISYNLPSLVGLQLNAGAFNDTVNVRSTSAATPVALNLGAGNDIAGLGAGPFFRLGQIASPVSVVGAVGADAIVLDDVNSGLFPVAGNNFTITATDVTRDNRQILRYQSAESLTLAAGTGNDTIRVASTVATTPVEVRAGLGNDTLQVGNSSAAALLGVVAFDGQGGSDTLDYSAFNSAVPVRVNLALGKATGVTSFSSIENVTGGPGDDILIGDEQANILKGGPGRDILIGRGGADTLQGGVGDDILIGCSTVHDLNSAALEAIMEEWGRTDLLGPTAGYLTRIAHLRGTLGDGFNGTTFLNLSKVKDDGVADSLDGNGGLDWFFRLGTDIIVARESPERVN
jgi:Ca2+-binding RTX toxin-like protein